jgi:phage gp29-like protein
LKSFTEPYLRGSKLYKLDWELEDLPYNRRMYMPTMVRGVDGRHLYEEVNFADEHYGKLKIRLKNDPLGRAIDDLPFDNHLLLEDGDTYEKHASVGAARRILPWFVALRFVQTWWIQYVENYGSPLRVGKYPRGASRTDRMKMKKFLEKLGQNGYGLFPSGMEVQLMDASKQGQVNTYKDFMKYGHTEYGVLLLGQASTTGDDPEGSYAKSVTMNGIRIDILQNVAKISGKGFRKLVKKGLRLNYGDDYDGTLCPRIEPILLDSSNAKERAQAAQIVSNNLGVAIPENHVYENILGVEKPRKGQTAYLNGQKFVYGEDPDPKPIGPQKGMDVANPNATEDKENDSVGQGETSEANGGAN